mmetsp:Transcript_32098/g.95858  ORF Transcript_32098/g.95858 Transcript_32098/m.95858 type:complete len:215 (-) Transcript_32098:1001-1645(-)
MQSSCMVVCFNRTDATCNIHNSCTCPLITFGCFLFTRTPSLQLRRHGKCKHQLLLQPQIEPTSTAFRTVLLACRGRLISMLLLHEDNSLHARRRRPGKRECRCHSTTQNKIQALTKPVAGQQSPSGEHVAFWSRARSSRPEPGGAGGSGLPGMLLALTARPAAGSPVLQQALGGRAARMDQHRRSVHCTMHVLTFIQEIFASPNQGMHASCFHI